MLSKLPSFPLEPIGECPEGTILKQGVIDTDGNKMPDECEYPVECPEFELPECKSDQTWCDSGYDINGCSLGGECKADCAEQGSVVSSDN